MKSLLKLLPAIWLVLAAGVASAQQPPTTPAPAPTLKPGSPAAMAAAKEYLTMKNAPAMYASAVPNIVEKVKTTLLQANLNYQKDLNEVAETVAKKYAGSESQITEMWATIYTNVFTEQELKDLVTFYKSPLGQKLLKDEPKAIQGSMMFMNDWARQFADKVNDEFRAEMKKRGKPV
jgi:hypothetical protein